jgi:hypothetical protein
MLAQITTGARACWVLATETTTATNQQQKAHGTCAGSRKPIQSIRPILVAKFFGRHPYQVAE